LVLARNARHAIGTTPSQPASINPLRREDGFAVSGLTSHEHRIAVGQDFMGRAAEVVNASNQALEAGRLHVVGCQT